MASTTSSSLANVIRNLHEICEKVASSAQDPSDQMRNLLSQETNGGIDLIPFYLNTFLPAFTRDLKSIISKSSVEAKKSKKQAEMYLSLLGIRGNIIATLTTTNNNTPNTITSEKDEVDMESVHPDKKNIIKKAFSLVNRALLLAPSTDHQLLQELYILRSILHYILDGFSSALVDLERVLNLRPANNSNINNWCTERKVELLKRLGRHQDAYLFVETKLAKLSKGGSQRKNSQQHLEVNKLRQLKTELKAYKPKTGETVVVDTALTTESQPQKNSKPTVLIELHPSVILYRDSFHRRLGVKAVKALDNHETIICEQPMLTVLETSSDAHHIYCAYCFLNCTNTFVPCTGCQDVVYCSKACAQMDALQDHLKCECSGVRGILNSYLPSAALHSFRFLARQDLADEQSGKKDKKGVFGEMELKKLPSAKKMTEFLKSGNRHSLEKVQQIFAETQAELRSCLLKKMTTALTGAQLASALLQWLFYVAVKGADQASEKLMKEECDKETYVTLLLHIAAEQRKVELTQFGWHSEKESDEDGISSSSGSDSSTTIQHGNFQCLLGSLIGPSCVPNAEWTFESGTQRFYIRTIKPVLMGEPISISYFDLTRIDFFDRQAQITGHFLISCPCSLCFSQSAHHFALRCTACNGPVPYDGQLLPNGRCLRCSKTLPSNSKAPAAVYADLSIISSTVSLLEGVGGASNVITNSQIRHLEAKLSKLTMLVDLHNRQLQKCIIGLCDEYIRRKEYDSAVAWYQWLVNTIGLHLSEVEEGVDDPFVNFKIASKWADAYIGFIEHFTSHEDEDDEGDLVFSGGKKRKKSSGLVKIRSSDLSTAKRLLKRLFAILEELNTGGSKYDETIIGREQYEALIDSMKQSAKNQYNHFKSLRRKARRGSRSHNTANYTALSTNLSSSEQTPILSKPSEERSSFN